MRSHSPDLAEPGGGRGSGVKRRPLHHQQQQSPGLLPHHHTSSEVSSSLDGDKKRSTSALERRLVFFRRLFHQSSVSSSSSRWLAWPILLTFMLIPIVLFHTLSLSSSSSSSSIFSWSLGAAGLAKGRQRMIVRRTIEPQSLYGRHARTIEYSEETHLLLDTENDSSASNTSGTPLPPLSFDIHPIATPRALPATATRAAPQQQQSSPIDHADTNNSHTPQHRLVKPMISRHAREELQDSSAYQDAQPDQFESKRCKAQFDWQKTAYLTCNLHHELDMTMPLLLSNNINHISNNDRQYPQQPADTTTDERLRLVANGYYRDVWVTNDYYHADIAATAKAKNTTVSNSNKIVLKTLRYEHDFDLRNWDRHRRDAIAMERLSASPFVLDVYASCGNSGLTEYAPGGSIKNALFPKRPPKPPPPPPKHWQVEPQPQQQQQQPAPKKPTKLERLRMGMYILA
jgi:hypothetical protein